MESVNLSPSKNSMRSWSSSSSLGFDPPDLGSRCPCAREEAGVSTCRHRTTSRPLNSLACPSSCRRFSCAGIMSSKLVPTPGSINARHDVLDELLERALVVAWLVWDAEGEHSGQVAVPHHAQRFYHSPRIPQLLVILFATQNCALQSRVSVFERRQTRGRSRSRGRAWRVDFARTCGGGPRGGGGQRLRG